MAVLKRSTGHSHLARPPTGENDARCLTRKSTFRLPQVSDLADWHVVSAALCQDFIQNLFVLGWGGDGGGNLLLCAVILLCACILNQKEKNTCQAIENFDSQPTYVA